MAISLTFNNFDYRTISFHSTFDQHSISKKNKKNFKELNCLPAKQTGHRPAPACLGHVCSEFNFEWPTNQKAGF